MSCIWWVRRPLNDVCLSTHIGYLFPHKNGYVVFAPPPLHGSSFTFIYLFFFGASATLGEGFWNFNSCSWLFSIQGRCPTAGSPNRIIVICCFSFLANGCNNFRSYGIWLGSSLSGPRVAWVIIVSLAIHCNFFCCVTCFLYPLIPSYILCLLFIWWFILIQVLLFQLWWAFWRCYLSKRGSWCRFN